jgi:hypothetical protein
VQSNISSAPLQTATQQQLIDRLNQEANAIRTLNASVEISTAVGGAKKGKVTEYTEISGYILLEKPDRLRMIGLVPVVRNRAFDMVSNGRHFALWIPSKNRFVVGPNQVTTPSPNPLENLRPQAVLDALLLPSVQLTEIAVLESRMQLVEDGTRKQLQQPNYILDILARKGGSGPWYLAHKIYFNRADLLPYRQLVFDENGDIETEAYYSDFKEFGGVLFPSRILIQRPREEYTIGLRVTRLVLNEPFKAEQFELQQPPGAQVQRLNGYEPPAGSSASQ